LSKPGELNVVLSMRKDKAIFRRLLGAFETLWEQGSVPLDEEQISRYEELREQAGGKKRPRTVALSRVLGRPRKPLVQKPSASRQYWCVGLAGWFSERSSAAIEEFTNWDSRGWGCFNIGQFQIHEGDRIILVSRPDSCVAAVEVTKTTRLPVSTPEGRRFAAYKDIRRCPRKKLTDTMWTKLKQAGLVKRKRQRLDNEKISEKRFRDAIGVLWPRR